MEVRSRFWIIKNDKNYLGEGKIELLEQIQSEGSISKAAKSMKMSYRVAWDLVDMMNNLSTSNLLHSQSGGGKDSGTKITKEGHEAIKAFRALQDMQHDLNIFLSCKNFEELKDKAKKLQKIINEIE